MIMIDVDMHDGHHKCLWLGGHEGAGCDSRPGGGRMSVHPASMTLRRPLTFRFQVKKS